jgi:hypothetical protein
LNQCCNTQYSKKISEEVITLGNWKNWEKYAKLGNNKLGHERLKKLGNLKSLEKSEKLREIEEFCNSVLDLFLKLLHCCCLIHFQVLHHQPKFLWFPL